MKNREWSRKLIISFLTGIITVCGAQKFFSAFAKEPEKVKDQPPPHVLCYRTASVDRPEQAPEERLQNLNQQLKTLEEQYKADKINEDTYNQRKSALQTQIDQINEQLKDDK